MTRVQPIPGMSQYTDTGMCIEKMDMNLYLYLYEAISKNRYQYGGYRYRYRFFNVISVTLVSVTYRLISMDPRIGIGLKSLHTDTD